MEELIKNIIKEAIAELLPRQPAADDGPSCYSVAEVAKRLEISRSLAMQLIKSGAIESFYVGRLPRVSSGALAKYIATQQNCNMEKINAGIEQKQKIKLAISGTSDLSRRMRARAAKAEKGA